VPALDKGTEGEDAIIVDVEDGFRLMLSPSGK
jgi:hypothetical protein